MTESEVQTMLVFTRTVTYIHDSKVIACTTCSLQYTSQYTLLLSSSTIKTWVINQVVNSQIPFPAIKSNTIKPNGQQSSWKFIPKSRKIQLSKFLTTVKGTNTQYMGCFKPSNQDTFIDPILGSCSETDHFLN